MPPKKQQVLMPAPSYKRCVNGCNKRADIGTNLVCRTTSTANNARAKCIKDVHNQRNQCINQCKTFSKK